MASRPPAAGEGKERARNEGQRGLENEKERASEENEPPGTPAATTPGRARQALRREVWPAGSMGTEERSPILFMRDRMD